MWKGGWTGSMGTSSLDRRPASGSSFGSNTAPPSGDKCNKGLTRRQLFEALPIFDCEFVGNESVGQAEARTEGRACILSSTWNRKPHPLVDMATQMPGKKKSKLLIYDPRLLGKFVKKKNRRG